MEKTNTSVYFALLSLYVSIWVFRIDIHGGQVLLLQISRRGRALFPVLPCVILHVSAFRVVFTCRCCLYGCVDPNRPPHTHRSAMTFPCRCGERHLFEADDKSGKRSQVHRLNGEWLGEEKVGYGKKISKTCGYPLRESEHGRRRSGNIWYLSSSPKQSLYSSVPFRPA